MHLVIGGAYQGKTAYVQQRFGVAEGSCVSCTETELPDFSAPCLFHLERFALYCLRQGVEPAQVLEGRELSGKILVADDISCGVVPMEPELRAWRECCGRMLSALSCRAETVTRIFCGLPEVLKG